MSERKGDGYGYNEDSTDDEVTDDDASRDGEVTDEVADDEADGYDEVSCYDDGAIDDEAGPSGGVAGSTRIQGLAHIGDQP